MISEKNACCYHMIRFTHPHKFFIIKWAQECKQQLHSNHHHKPGLHCDHTIIIIIIIKRHASKTMNLTRARINLHHRDDWFCYFYRVVICISQHYARIINKTRAIANDDRSDSLPRFGSERLVCIMRNGGNKNLSLLTWKFIQRCPFQCAKGVYHISS